LVESPLLEEGLERLCSLLFRSEERVNLCKNMLLEAAEKGYVHVPWQDGQKWQVARKLREAGILERRRLPACSEDRLVVVYVPDRKRLTRIRLAFETLDRPWPPCI